MPPAFHNVFKSELIIDVDNHCFSTCCLEYVAPTLADQLMISPLIEEHSHLKALDQRIDESISLVFPNFVIKLVNIYKSQ